MIHIKEEEEEIIVDVKNFSNTDIKKLLNESNLIPQNCELKIIKEEPEDPLMLKEEDFPIKEEEKIINYDPFKDPVPCDSSETSKNLKIECFDCHRKFFRVSRFNAHRCQFRSRSICDICHSSFLYKKNLVQHILEKHIERPKIFSCDNCPKLFASKHYLRNHVNGHQKATIACQICSKEIRVCRLKQHTRRVHKLTKNLKNVKFRSYKCSKCPKSFTRSEILKTHEATHVMKFNCEKCSKKFALRISYKNHLKSHENLKSFKCEKCEKAFNTRKGLTQHGATHIETKDLKCDGCGKFFRNWPNLHQHKKKHCNKKLK